MFATLISIVLISAQSASDESNQQSPENRASTIGQSRDFFPPWEGSGVFIFYPYRLDLNHARESFSPMSRRGIRDCTNAEYFCLTARSNDQFGLIHMVAPRRCVGELRVGQNWQVGEVRTEVLAAIRTNDPLQPHFRRPDVIHFLGDASNPQIVYEYWGYGGIVAIHHGLVDHPNLVADVRSGLDPFTLPTQHRLALITFDRFAGCRYR